jgi:anti-sigma factor RsiW
MNHPTREEWMAYLYGEISRGAKGKLIMHLDACDECRANVANWRHTMLALDSWELPAAQARRNWTPVVKWAAAAAVLLFAGFGFGRAVSPTATAKAEAIRAAIEPSLKNSLETDLRQKLAREIEDKWRSDFAAARARLMAEYKKQLEEELAKASDTTLAAAERLVAEFDKVANEKQAEEKQIFLALLKELETKRLTDYAALRKDLETVAVLTEVGLRSAQQEIVQLASDRTPRDNE